MHRTIFTIFGIIIIGFFGYFLKQSGLAQFLFVGIENFGFKSTIAVPYDAISNKVQEKTRVLIVPGHEPNLGGTQFGDFYERDLTAELGQYLRQFLQSDGGYQVFITRNADSWNPTFADYFKNNWNDIGAWVKTSERNVLPPASLGAPASAPKVIHNKAPADVGLRIYGINKWANENDIDLTIHIHLNNYPRRHERFPGKYSGLVIYVPAQQYSNSVKTHVIAESVFKRLAMYNPINDLPAESSGIIDDSELISVGANNTSNAASMLIEYDYIYQPQFINPEVRSLALKDLAYQTYLGLRDFFTKNNNVYPTNSYDPTVLYEWNNPGINKNLSPSDIYALQTVLIMDEEYPPSGKSKNDCPHSGILGPCTVASLKEFQKKYGIADEDGIAGEKTLNLLNLIYSGKGIKL